MSMRKSMGIRAAVRLLFFVTGLGLSSGCTKPCGSVRDGMAKYHDVCVAVNFREHVERTGSSKSSVEDYGVGYDLTGEPVDLVGSRVGQLRPFNTYNLRGDFVEVDAKIRLRVFAETDVNASNHLLIVILAFCVACYIVYRWSFRVGLREHNKKK